MARKAVNGYPEKSYYDNTVFGGVVATGDPLNEGSFALMTNLDIAYTGKSVRPRNGFLSTILQVDNKNIILSSKILFFRDPKLTKDIVIDLNAFNLDALDSEVEVEAKRPFAYLTDLTQYNLKNKKIPSSVISLTHIDCADLLTLINDKVEFDVGTSNEYKLTYLFNNSSLVDGMELRPIVDLNGVRYFITKLSFDNKVGVKFKFILKVLYRQNTSTEYTGDTLVFSFVNTSEQTTSLNPSARNVASRKSLIMDPLRYVATGEQVVDLTLPETILLEYESKYALRAPLKLKTQPQNLKLVPTFTLPIAKSNFVGEANAFWAYRFDITNTSVNTEDIIRTYRTPWRVMEDVEGDVDGIIESTKNLPIEKLYIDPTVRREDPERYYVIPTSANNILTNNVDISETVARKNELLFNRMLINGGAGSSGTALGNAVSALYTAESIGNVLKSFNLKTVQDIDTFMFPTLGYMFIKEKDLAPYINEYYGTLEEQRDRRVTLSTNAVNYLETVRNWELPTNKERWAPSLTFDKIHYENISKMNIEAFKKDAAENIQHADVEVIFLPWARETVGGSGGNNNIIQFSSFNAVYMDGLNQYHNSVGFDAVPPYDLSYKNRNKITGSTSLWSTTTGVYYTDGGQQLANLTLHDFIDHGVFASAFDNGIAVTMYIKPVSEGMLNNIPDDTSDTAKENLIGLWDASSYTISANYLWDKDEAFVVEVDEENPDMVENANNFIIFEDRIVTWYGSRVYLSDEGNYHFYKKELVREFPEEILKVIAFKTVLLVFGIQNMYAIYRTELDTPTGAYNEEGVPEYAKVLVWLQQPVLYNLNPDRKYLDVIQIYNQMVLFYSNEGQLYMIQPSTTIDSDTQFSIRYFNKSANDIIANYEHYINERLRMYGKVVSEDNSDHVVKEDVRINCLVDIDLIKIFYTVPDRITFILVYDVINNRYYTYDTLSFTNISVLRHVEGGELYFTKQGNNHYLTLTVLPELGNDQHHDAHYIRQYRKEPIFALIDTGNLNLNNHITKRLRDLKLVLKNIDATKILYNAEVYLDDSRVRAFYAPDFKVTMSNGPSYTMKVEKTPTDDLNELFGMLQTIGVEGSRDDLTSYYLHHDTTFFENNALLKTETLNSNRLIEYNSNILGIGKVVRLKLQFIAKGNYKVQSFAIVYKERRV